MKLNLLLLGAIAGLVVKLFESSLKVMYPEGASGFLQLYIGALLLVGILSWIIWRRVGQEGEWSKVSFFSLTLLGMLSLIAGLSYSFDHKTEEFLFYFLLTSITSIACLVELVRQLRYHQKFTSLPWVILGLGIGLISAVFFSSMVLSFLVVVFLFPYSYLALKPDLIRYSSNKYG